MRPYGFLIRPDQSESLKELKRRNGAAEGWSIRQALDEYFNRLGVSKVKPERKSAAGKKR